MRILTGIVLALSVGEPGSFGLTQASAAEQPVAPSQGSLAFDLTVGDGELNGRFMDRALSEVLEALATQAGFVVLTAATVGHSLVSGEFENEPLAEALGSILTPYNYIIAYDEAGRIKTLEVAGPRNRAREVVKTPARIAPVPGGDSGPLVTALPGVELSIEHRHLFEEAALGGTDILPEVLDVFQPRPEPDTEETGPPLPEGYVVKDLPHFERTSEAAPPGEDAVGEDLPDFDPIITEFGPRPDGVE